MMLVYFVYDFHVPPDGRACPTTWLFDYALWQSKLSGGVTIANQRNYDRLRGKEEGPRIPYQYDFGTANPSDLDAVLHFEIPSLIDEAIIFQYDGSMTGALGHILTKHDEPMAAWLEAV